jgi:predicted transcriptional regulator
MRVWNSYDDSVITTVNLPDDLHAALKRVAEAEHRSANATIIMAVTDYVSRRDKQGRVRALAADVAERHKELLDRLAQ